MKKTLFALEVLLMLSALPIFCGLAMGRKSQATEQLQDPSFSTGTKQNAEAIILKLVGCKNS